MIADNIEQDHKKCVSAAIEIAENDYDADLDFSNKSIDEIERILGDIFKQTGGTNISKRELVILSMIFGSYIAEVVERNFDGGRLEKDHPQVGQDSYPYYLGPSVFFPINWCYKRLTNGEEDNVSDKYEAFVINTAENEKSLKEYPEE